MWFSVKFLDIKFMAKRAKRLEKGIESLEEQIAFHEEKKRKALELGQEELVNYYEKEICALKRRKDDREDKVKK